MFYSNGFTPMGFTHLMCLMWPTEDSFVVPNRRKQPARLECCGKGYNMWLKPVTNKWYNFFHSQEPGDWRRSGSSYYYLNNFGFHSHNLGLFEFRHPSVQERNTFTRKQGHESERWEAETSPWL